MNVDIKELWDIGLEDYYVAAVLDEGVVKVCTRKAGSYTEQNIKNKINHCDVHKYFNSGVLVMNLKILRENMNLFDEASKFMKRHLHSCQWADQEVLNSLFYNHVKFIDGKFNRLAVFYKSCDDLKGSISHSAAGSKLWSVTGTPAQYFYWDYYLRSAWGENTTREELVKIMLNAVPEQKLTKPHWTIRILLKIRNKIYPDWLKRTIKMLWIEFLYRIGFKK